MRRSTIDTLPTELREELLRQLRNGFSSLDELSEWLAARGHRISRSAIHRFAVRLRKGQIVLDESDRWALIEDIFATLKRHLSPDGPRGQEKINAKCG